MEQYTSRTSRTEYGLWLNIQNHTSDGSEVWLNSGSSISYPKQHQECKKKCATDWRSLFKVTSDKSNRFDVTTANGLQVSAYGTEFNVKGLRR